MIQNYTNRVCIKNDIINGEGGWYWVDSDIGAFGIPLRDWLDSHQYKYFKYLKKADVIVTGGTCCGMYARFYAKMFNYVYAFEPDPLSFYCMVNNNPFENVIKLNCAIGQKNGIVGITRQHASNIGMNTVTDKNEFHIPMLSIDSLNLDDCDMIQLDVEGFEENAINGALNTIKKYKPVIIAENFNSESNQKIMDQLGYELKDQSFMDFIYTPKV